MELDHIFIFTDNAGQAAYELQQLGLTEGSSNVHIGQGTSCRRFYFNNAYLELVWVSNEEEIKNGAVAETKLWERSQYKQTGYCPFGFCFRRIKENKESAGLIFDDGWQYRPPYLPQNVYAHIASNKEFPAEPMLFEMPFFGLAPKDYSEEKKQPLHHTIGFQQITKVTVTLPAPVEKLSPSLQQVIRHSIIQVVPGNTFSIEVEFDEGSAGKLQDFMPLLPLTIRW
jgi:hypothetical protein